MVSDGHLFTDKAMSWRGSGSEGKEEEEIRKRHVWFCSDVGLLQTLQKASFSHQVSNAQWNSVVVQMPNKMRLAHS